MTMESMSTVENLATDLECRVESDRSGGLYASFVPGWYEAYFSISVADRTITATKYPNAEDSLLPINSALPAGATHPFDALFLLNAT